MTVLMWDWWVCNGTGVGLVGCVCDGMDVGLVAFEMVLNWDWWGVSVVVWMWDW